MRKIKRLQPGESGYLGSMLPEYIEVLHVYPKPIKVTPAPMRCWWRFWNRRWVSTYEGVVRNTITEETGVITIHVSSETRRWHGAPELMLETHFISSGPSSDLP